MRRVLDVIVSIRTTVVLLLLLALLLLTALLVPQRAVLGEQAVDAISASRGAHSFLIDTLGLGSIATSPVFITILALFYVNLAAVLIDRTPRTLGKMRVKAPTPEAMEKWIASPKTLEGTAAQPLDGSIVTILRGHGYKPFRVTKTALYGVKHRSAALGFLVFHTAFFFFAIGGVMIWYTRYVGETRAVEGQLVEAKNARLVRMPKVGGVPPVAFAFDRIVPTFDSGDATDLRATIRFKGMQPVDSRVNHPAEDGPTSVLVTDIGIAPVLWLQDANGFGLDRVAVPADRHESVDIPMAAGTIHVRIAPKSYRPDFPLRDALRTLPVELAVIDHGKEVFRGALHPGEGAAFPGGRVVLQEVRYWAGLKIISERGGGLLIFGFALLTIGAIWRLLMHRRDLVVAWDGPRFRLAGHGEWFADRDKRELMSLCAAIEKFTLPRGHEVMGSRGVEAPRPGRHCPDDPQNAAASTGPVTGEGAGRPVSEVTT